HPHDRVGEGEAEASHAVNDSVDVAPFDLVGQRLHRLQGAAGDTRGVNRDGDPNPFGRRQAEAGGPRRADGIGECGHQSPAFFKRSRASSTVASAVNGPTTSPSTQTWGAWSQVPMHWPRWRPRRLSAVFSPMLQPKIFSKIWRTLSPPLM